MNNGLKKVSEKLRKDAARHLPKGFFDGAPYKGISESSDVVAVDEVSFDEPIDDGSENTKKANP